MRKSVLVAGCLLLAGCSRYADFKLAVLSGSGSGSVRAVWSVAPEPILAQGDKGAWDSVDALNPSVVQAGGKFWNFYSGYDGRAWHTGVATSNDGLAWTKRGSAILSPDPRTWEGDYIAANGSAVHHRGEFLYWYQGGRVPRIGLASSKDARQWSKHPEPVLEIGPRGSWEERGVADPYVIQSGEWFYMYYLGQDRARRQRLGVARSRDGIEWEKHRGNPILELGEPGAFDDTGLGEPAVWASDNWYWMLYTARDRKEYRRLGLARSKDGVTWSRVSTAPVLSGSAPWNSAVVCDPHVMPEGTGLRVWFGGGNRPEPAENLNGQIGYATLRLEPAP